MSVNKMRATNLDFCLWFELLNNAHEGDKLALQALGGWKTSRQPERYKDSLQCRAERPSTRSKAKAN